MTKEDLAEILCMVGNAILSKSKEAEESSIEEGTFEGDFDDAALEPVAIQEEITVNPPVQTVTTEMFSTPAISPELQNMLQQKEEQIANLQSQLTSLQTSNLGFTPIKL